MKEITKVLNYAREFLPSLEQLRHEN